jgi:aminopeptidase N
MKKTLATAAMLLISASSTLPGSFVATLSAQSVQAGPFTHADTLRGSDGPARAWWDVTFYDLNVTVDVGNRSVEGWNAITYRVLNPATEMQIDLQSPLQMDSILQGGQALQFQRDGNAFFVQLAAEQVEGSTEQIIAYYHGTPRAAVNPPWDGGFIWRRDSTGADWVATANQGLGASVWWPTKDLQSAEPDSQRVAITAPDPLVDVSNGRLRSVTPHGDGTTTYEWFIGNPINNYNVTVTLGEYAHWQEFYAGELGTLTMDFWPLAVNEKRARAQWVQARTTMQCFEDWFGPYPWYSDGYKLIETPHLGMEHQSAVAYGNGFQNGYLGRDLSNTGQGLKWDFIIVHESAHEWWGNNITAADISENWIHEGFAAYSENLYTECLTGSREAGAEYVIGTRAAIANDRPIVGPFGVNVDGTGDMYYKGANLLHTIRQIVDDDERWRGILRGLNETFRHSIVTGKELETYISEQSGTDLSKIFDQYLRTTRVPVFEYRRDGARMEYRWSNVVDGFEMPVRVMFGGGEWKLLHPNGEWQSAETQGEIHVDENFYVEVREAG